MYPIKRARVNLVERHGTRPIIHNVQNTPHRLRKRIGTHTANGHGNNNRQPNGETKGTFYTNTISEELEPGVEPGVDQGVEPGLEK